jgi:hypothetical protein
VPPSSYGTLDRLATDRLIVETTDRSAGSH